MKKVFVLIAFVLFAFALQAQTVKTFAGAASDTLTASVTKSYIIPIGSNVEQRFTIAVFTDHISGTDTYTASLTHSLDGTNYHAILSAPNETHAAGSDNSWAWSNINIYTYAAAVDDTTASGTLRYYNVLVDTPLLTKFVKVSLVATAAAQKSAIYGYYIIGKKD